MNIISLLTMVCLILLILLMGSFSLAYSRSVMSKCSIEEALDYYKSIVKRFIKSFFGVSKKQEICLKIGINEQGFFTKENILDIFKDFNQLFQIFKLAKMPIEKSNYIIYTFCAHNLESVNDEILAEKFIKQIVESIIQNIFIDYNVNLDVCGFAGVNYDMDKGILIISIAKSPQGIQEVGNFEINMDRLKNKKRKNKSFNDDIKESWNDDKKLN